MKKKFLKVKNFADAEKMRRKIKDTFASGKAEELRDAVLALIDEIENSEVEINEEEFASAVMEIFNQTTEEEIPQAITDSIVKKIGLKMKSIQDSIKPGDRITKKIKNSICGAILKSNRNDVRENVEKILVENGITGLTFTDIIDYTISTKWEDLNPLYSMFNQTQITKFHYTTDEMTSVEVFAKGWKKTNTGVKVIQKINVENKRITTQYVYKKQQIAFEDLDDLQMEGQLATFLQWLNTEIDKQIINAIVIAILVSDKINTGQHKIVTFESIGNKTAADAFTSISESSGAVPSITDVREMCDLIFNPNGKRKVLVMDQKTLTKLSEFMYATGGTVMYRTKEEMAGQFGVDDIYITDVLGQIDGLQAICLLPDGYWIKEKNYISVEYPTWEINTQSYQKERNTGGAIHDLLSTAILKAPSVTP